MTEHPHRLLKGMRTSPPVSLLTPGSWEGQRLGRSVELRRPTQAEVDQLWQTARQSLPSIAPRHVIDRVLAQNADALWAICQRTHGAPDHSPARGFIATLPVSDRGLRQLAENTFNATNPEPSAIARPGERPAAIYIWAVYAPGSLIAAVPLLLSGPYYSDFDIIARAATDEGARLAESLGLERNAIVDGVRAPHLYVLQRTQAAESNSPTYDSYRPGLSQRTVSISVVNSIDQFLRVLSIRAAVFMAEQVCPYEEEFDGNDFAGNHLLGFVGDEPAGCARIRYFAGFAKIERVAVRAEYRHSRLAFELASAAIDLCRKKGYRTLYCHSQRRWARLWKRFGFVPYDGSREFVFSDHDYIELMASVAPHADPLAIRSDPYVLIRPEGRWHEPGVLENSVARGSARCPSTGANH